MKENDTLPAPQSLLLQMYLVDSISSQTEKSQTSMCYIHMTTATQTKAKIKLMFQKKGLFLGSFYSFHMTLFIYWFYSYHN